MADWFLKGGGGRTKAEGEIKGGLYRQARAEGGSSMSGSEAECCSEGGETGPVYSWCPVSPQF